MKFCRTALFVVLIMSAHGASASGLRVTCDGEDVGAEVEINGKFKGECPVDIIVPEGTYKLRVFKAVDASQERVFEQVIRMGDGVTKRVEAVLTVRLTAAGQKLEAERLAAEAQRSAAEARREVERLAVAAKREARIGAEIAAAMVPIPGKNYEIGKTEVTQDQWQAVMGSNPSYFSNCGDTCPVEQVSWDDVQIFLQKLNAITGKQYRLPTGAEWLYACYGGSQTKYCGGNDLNAVGWFSGNSSTQTHPVGQKQANGYGLVDMTGNVWEWQSDCRYGDCPNREIRSGSWLDGPWYASLSNYEWRFPAYRGNFIGVRLARTLP